MTIGVLAVQGAFAEHIKRLKELGIDSVELRKKDDLYKPFDGIILPGGLLQAHGRCPLPRQRRRQKPHHPPRCRASGERGDARLVTGD